MKKVLTIVLAMLCLASCEKSTQKNDLAELKLKGKVKSIRKIPYEAVEKLLLSDIVLNEKVVYQLENMYNILEFELYK